jgi:uncharacterized protein (UPF0248 family)
VTTWVVKVLLTGEEKYFKEFSGNNAAVQAHSYAAGTLTDGLVFETPYFTWYIPLHRIVRVTVYDQKNEAAIS